MDVLQISLAAARVNARMTQEDVSRCLHVGKQTIANWEKGKVLPSFASLKMLSDLYGISVDNFLLPSKST